MGAVKRSNRSSHAASNSTLRSGEKEEGVRCGEKKDGVR